MKNVIDIAKRDNVKVIFVQPQINSKVVEVIARDIDGEIFTVDPLKYDYLTELKRIAETFYE
jgi:zinc transport system substrate-binding protein